MAEEATMSMPPIFRTAKNIYVGAVGLRDTAMQFEARSGGMFPAGRIIDGLLDKFFFSPITDAGTAAINAPLKGLLPHLGLDPDNEKNQVYKHEVGTALQTVARVELVDVFFDALVGLIPKKDIDMIVTSMHDVGLFKDQLDEHLLNFNERVIIARVQAGVERQIEAEALASGHPIDPNLLELRIQEAREATRKVVQEKIKNHEIEVPTDRVEMPEDSRSIINMLPVPKRIIQGIVLAVGGALTLRYRLQDIPILKNFYNMLSPLMDRMQKSTIYAEDTEKLFNEHFTSPTALQDALYNPVASSMDVGKALAIYEMAIPNADGTAQEPAFAALRAKPKYKGDKASQQDQLRYDIASTGATLAYMQSFHQAYGELMQKHNGLMAMAKEATAGLMEQARLEGMSQKSGLLDQEDHMLTTEQLRNFFREWLEEPQGLNSDLIPLQDSFRNALSNAEPYNSALTALYIIRDHMMLSQEHKVIFEQAIADVAREQQNPYFKLSDRQNMQTEHEEAQERIVHIRDEGMHTPGGMLHIVLSEDISRRDVGLAMQSLDKNHAIHSKTTYAQARMDKEFESDYLASTLPRILEKTDALLDITKGKQDSKEQKRAFSKQLKRMDADMGSLKLSEGQLNEEAFALALAMHWMSDECKERLTSIMRGMEQQGEFDHIRLDDIEALLTEGATHDEAGINAFRRGGNIGETMAAEGSKASSKRDKKVKDEAGSELVETVREDARSKDDPVAEV